MSLGTAVRQLQQQYSTAQIREMIRLYTAAYGNSGMNARQVLEEMVCDAMGEMNAFATEETSTVAGEVGQFLRDLRKTALETQTDGQKNNAQEGVKHSREMDGYDYTKSFEQQLEDWKDGKIPKNDTLLVGATPEVFKGIGMPALPVTINGTHIDYALNNSKDFDHFLGADLLKQLPEAIKKPVAIMTSGTKSNSSVVAMLEVRHNGKQVIVPVAVGGFGFQNGIQIDSNAITSAYGKNNSISKVLHDAIEQERNGNFRLYYLDEEKATALFQVARVPMPKMPGTHDGGFIHSLTDTASPVKLKISSVTQSQQFKRWFGDWQNDPAHASKVVNADGTPKVVYHQTDADFTIFDPRHEGAGTRDSDTPFGIFLKSSDKNIGLKGSKQMPLYADIKNPLTVRNREQLIYELQKISDGYATELAEHRALDVQYEQKRDNAIRELREYIIQWRKENPDASRTALYDDSRFNQLFNAEDDLTDEWESKAREIELRSKEAITRDLEAAGYDGMIIQQDVGSFGRSTDAYIALHPEQVKSATDNIGTFDGKNPDIRYSRELDSEYMELAKDPEGNSTELRKMVDQAAEQQGYKTLFYHGSKKGGGFTEFRDWQYFTPKKEYAERYAQRGNPDSLYSVFVKMENPFDTRNAKARRIFQKARGELGLSEIQGTGLPDWTDGYDLADYIDENGLNYDAIVLDEGGDLVNGKPVSRGLSYVVRKSNQVKSADAVVYDDNGKVIPLSERFNSDKRDIRYSRELELDSEGNALTQEQTDFFADSEVRNDDGELIPVYHKTTESFTVFQRGKLGKETLGNADDASLAATSLIGHWFSDSENTPFMGNAMKTYLNIKKPYYTSLDELAADLGDFSGDLEMMQDHFDRGQYNMVREAARSYVRWMKWKGYDGLIVNDTETGGTSYVILNSNQAKLTDNGNPTSKRDIRYSRELETVEALKRQNEILQKQRDYWKEQTRTTEEKKRGADKGEVRSLAGQLIRQYSSKTEVEEILPEMQWLADSIWRNDPKISYTDLQDSAQNIARMVLDGSEVNLNAENWETGQELKRFLRGRYINVDESLKENIGDFKNFKRSNRSLHFRENGTGTGVASLWLELQNDFGKGLFPDSISNPGDQIRHIADTLTSLTESDIQNPYAADMELTVEQMAYDVMARAAGLNRQKATKTDNTTDLPLLYSVRMLTWAEVSWSMLPSS